jgi:hypothetical protein
MDGAGLEQIRCNPDPFNQTNQGHRLRLIYWVIFSIPQLQLD